MSTTEAPQAIRTKPDADPQPADVLVIFGITGDLAKVMTFHSLYRLEQRGLLDCPIVGVAFDDWTLDQLVQRGLVWWGSTPRCSGVKQKVTVTSKSRSASI